MTDYVISLENNSDFKIKLTYQTLRLTTSNTIFWISDGIYSHSVAKGRNSDGFIKKLCKFYCSKTELTPLTVQREIFKTIVDSSYLFYAPRPMRSILLDYQLPKIWNFFIRRVLQRQYWRRLFSQCIQAQTKTL